MKNRSFLDRILSRNKAPEASVEPRQYVAEQLEARILFSGAPVDAAPVEEAPQETAGTVLVTNSRFESVDDFGESAQFVLATELDDNDLQSEDQIVSLISFDNLSEEEIEQLAQTAVEYWKGKDLTEEQTDLLEALEVSLVDLDAFEDMIAPDDSDPEQWIVEENVLGDDVEFADLSSLFIPETLVQGLDLIIGLLEEMNDPIGLQELAEAQVAKRTTEVAQMPLTTSTLDELAEAAEERWIQSGLTAEQIAALNSIQYRIVDLEGSDLGYAEGTVITIDIDAAGRQWFVDSTPLLDEEFQGVAGSDTQLNARIGEAARDRIDLVTVLMHEQGHILGLLDLNSSQRDNLMFGVLGTGERRLMETGQAEGSSPLSLEGKHFMTTFAMVADGTGTFAWNDPLLWTGGGGTDYPGFDGTNPTTDDSASIAFSNGVGNIDLGGNTYTISALDITEGAGNGDGRFSNGTLVVSNITYLSGGREVYFQSDSIIKGPDGGDLLITNTPNHLRFLGELRSGVGGSITVDGSRVVRIDPTTFSADVFNHSITNRDDGLTPGFSGLGSYIQFAYTNTGTAGSAFVGTYNVNSDGWLLLDRAGTSGTQALAVTNLSLNTDWLNYRSQDTTATRIIVENLLLNNAGSAVGINIQDWGKLYVTAGGTIGGDLDAELIFAGNGHVELEAGVTSVRTGPTTIAGGTVRIQGTEQPLGTGVVTIQSGATLDIDADHTAIPGNLPTIIVEAGGALTGDLRGYTLADFGAIGSGAKVQLAEGAIWNSRTGVDITITEIPTLQGDLVKGLQTYNETTDLNASGNELFGSVAFNGDTDNEYRGVITGLTGQDLDIEVLSHGSSSLTSVVRWDRDNAGQEGVLTLNSDTGVVNVTLRESGIDVYTRGAEGLGTNGNWTTLNIAGESPATAYNQRILFRQSSGADTGYTVGAGQTLNVANARLDFATNAAGQSIHANAVVNIQSGGVLFLDDDLATSGTFNIEDGGIVWINAATRLDNGAAFNFASGATLVIDNDLDPTGMTNLLVALSAVGVNIVFNDADADTLVGGLTLADNAVMTGRGSGSNDFGDDINFTAVGSDGTNSVTFIAADVVQADGDTANDLRLDLNGNVFLSGVDITIGSAQPTVTVVDGNVYINQFEVAPGGIIDFQGTTVEVGNVTVESGRLLQGDGDTDTFTADSLIHNSSETSIFSRGTATIAGDVTISAGIVDFDRADSAITGSVIGGDVIIGGGSGTAELQVGYTGTTGPVYSDLVLDGSFTGGDIYVNQGGHFQLEILTDTVRRGPLTIGQTFVISGDNTTSNLNSQLEHDIQGNTPAADSPNPGDPAGVRAVHYADIQLEDGAVLGINEFDGSASATLVLRGNATVSALGGADPFDLVDVSSDVPGTARTLTIGEVGEPFVTALLGTLDSDSSLNVQVGSSVDVSAATINGGLLGAGTVSGPVVIGASGYLAGGGLDQQGALIVVGDVSFAAGGKFLVQVDDATDIATTVQVVGDIDFSGATIDFLTGSIGDDDSYTILTATGTISGLATGDVFGDYAVDITDGVVRLVRNVAQFTLTGNGEPIAFGDNSPSTGDHTILGARLTNGPDIQRTFTISNPGTEDLTISDITVGDSVHFAIVNFTLGTVVAPGGSVTFDVVFLGDATAGDYTTTVTVDHNDTFFADNGPDDSPFVFDVSATQSIFASLPQTRVEVTDGKIVITDTNPDGGKNDALTITQDGTDIIIRSTTGVQDIQALNGVAQTNGQEVRIANGLETNGITFNLSGEAFAGGDVVIIGSDLLLHGDFIVNDGDIQLAADVRITASNATFNGSINSVPGENYALSFGAATGTVTFNGFVGATDALASLDTTGASSTVFGDNAAVTQSGLTLNWDAALDRGDGTYWDSTVNATDTGVPSTFNSTSNSNRWDWTGVGTLSAGDVSATSNLAGVSHAFELGISGATGANLTSFENEMSVVRNGSDSDWSNENFALELVFRTPDLTGSHVLWESGAATGSDGSVLYLEDGKIKLSVEDTGVIRTVELDLPSANEFHQVTAFIDVDNDIVQLWLNGGLVAGGSQAISTETGGTFNDWSTSQNGGLGRANDQINISGLSTFDGDFAVVRAYRLPGANFGDAEVLTNWNALNTARVNTVSVTTSGAQSYSASVTLGASTTLSGTTVTFNGDVTDDGNGATLSELTITATGGDLTFHGQVGAAAELSSLTTSVTGTIRFTGGSAAEPLQVKSSGVQVFNGAVETTSADPARFTADHLTFGGTANFAGDTVFLADAISGIYYTSQPDFIGQISFADAVTFAGTASVTAESFSFAASLALGAGDSSFLATNNGTFSGRITGAGANLNVQVANVTDFAGGMDVASINTYFGGYTKIGGDVTLSGSVNNAFNNQVLLSGGNVVVDATGGAGGVTFGSTIDSGSGGNQSLTVNANSDIVFGGNVGSDALGALSQDNGLEKLITGGTGTVYVRNYGTGYNPVLAPIDADGPNLFLNYVAGLDPASTNLWEDLVGRYEDLEGSSTVDYLSSNNFGDLDLNTNGAPTAVTDSAHQGIRAAFTTPAVGRSLEDFFPINGSNLSNVDASIEVWVRPTDFTGNHVIWETGQQGSAGAGLILEGSILYWMVRESATSGEYVSVDLVNDLGLDTTDFIQIVGIYDRDLTSTSAADDRITLFVNGVEVVAPVYGNIDDISSGDDLGLGRENSSLGGFSDSETTNPFPGNADDYDNNFVGEIAIYRVWREALDAAQVQAAYDVVHNGITMATTSGVGFGGNPVVLESDLSLGALIIGIDDETTFDQLTVTNGFSLDLTNAHDLLFNVGFPFTSPPANNTTYTIIDNQNISGGLSGVFANAPDDTEFTANGFRWKVNYNVGDGNDVVLTFLGVTTVLDAELSLSGGVLTVSDVTSDSANNLTITEVNDGGVDYLVFSSAAGALGIAAGSDMPANFERIGGDTVRIDKTLVSSLIVQTAFLGDEDIDSSEDTVNINTDLNLSGDLIVTADNLSVNGVLSSGGTITLRGDTGVSFGSSNPDLTGNLNVTGGIISVNTTLNVSGTLTFAGTSAVNLNADVTSNGPLDISVTSPDPSVASVNLNSANLRSSLGNITLTGTKVLGASLTLQAVDVFLFDGDDALIGFVNNTFGNTNLNGNTLTVDVTGVDGYQTGRIIGVGSLVKEGTGTWDFNAYGDITTFPNNNTAPNLEVRNDFTGGPVLVNAGTLAVAKGSQYQGRAIRNTLDVVIASGATLDLVQSNTLGDLVRVQIDAGGTFILNSADTIGSVTGAGALVIEGGSLQMRNDGIREFAGEMTGDQNLLLLGQYNAERPWILTETGFGTYTGTIIIGSATGNSIDANPQHGLFVNGITDAQAISVRSQQEANNTNDNVAGTLGGIGTIQSTVTSQILTTFKPGQDGRGTLSTGTLTVEGNVILGAPSQDAAINAEALITPYYTNLEMRVDDAGGTSDRLVVTGDLDISLTDLTLFELDGSTVLSASDDAYYTLITYGGTLTGTEFNSVTGLPAGYEINFDTAGEIRLTTIEPAVINFTPSDDLSGLQVNSELVIEFNQPIQAGTGNITIVGGASPVVIPIGDPQISISGSILTINPGANLELDTEYHVLIDATAITDTSASPKVFPGISDPTTWNFRTSDTPPPETVVRLDNGVLTITDIEGDSVDNLTIIDDGLGQYVITDTGGLTVGAGIGVNDTDLAPNSVSVGKNGITSIVFNTKNASGDSSADVVTISSAIIRSGDISITAETIYLDAPVVSTAGTVTFNGNVILNTDLSLGGSRINFNGTVNSDAGQNRALSFDVGTGTVVFNSVVGGTDALSTLDTSNATATLLGDNPVVAQQPFLSLNWDAALDRGDGVYWDSTINAGDVTAGAPLSTDRSGNRWDWTGVTTLAPTDVSATSNLAGITWAYDLGGANAGAQMGSFESEVGYPLRNGNDPNWTDENVAIEIVFSPAASDLVGGPFIVWESGSQPGEDGTAIYIEDGVLKLLTEDATVSRTVVLSTPLVAGQFYQLMAMIDLGNDLAKLWLNGGTSAGGEQAVSSETGGTFNDWSTSRNQGIGRVTDWAVTGNSTPGFNGQIAVMRAYRDVPVTFGDLEAKTNWDVLNTTRTSSVAVTTTGSQTYSASVTLGASTTLNASEIIFGGTVDDDGNGATISDLTVNTTAGDVTFNGSVGGTAELTGVTTGAAGTVHFNGGTVSVPLQVKTSGSQTFGGDVASDGNTGFIADHLTFQGATDFVGDVSFKADALTDVYYTGQSGFTGRITFAGGSTITGTATLSAESFSFGGTLELGAGTSSFLAINTGTFSDKITGSGADLNIQVAGVTDFAKGMDVASINTYFGGYTKLGGDVILNGSINNAFNNQVLITGGNVVIDATAGSGGITFGSTIDSSDGGNQSLTVNANGDIIFGGNIGTDSLGALSQDSGLGSLTTGGTGNVYLRNNGTGYGSNLFLNYVAALDPASIDLWEDLVGALEDLEGSSTLDFLGSNNFADLDLIANGAPTAVTDSAHQGIHAAFTTQAQGRGLEDFYPVNNSNLSNVDVTVELWARLNSGYETDTTARVIWETGSSGASQPGMARWFRSPHRRMTTV
ncbi:MAG: Ig-like domain-containing protein [Verrucomicrobiales bacterium]|nr:Ig-like domain-containing protein [Verrucomicrobiales bacterium]